SSDGSVGRRIPAAPGARGTTWQHRHRYRLRTRTFAPARYASWFARNRDQSTESAAQECIEPLLTLEKSRRRIRSRRRNRKPETRAGSAEVLSSRRRPWRRVSSPKCRPNYRRAAVSYGIRWMAGRQAEDHRRESRARESPTTSRWPDAM